MEKLTQSYEDYLEAIVMLGGTEEVLVRSVDIAEKLGVSKVSVNKALAVLKKAGYIGQDPYCGIRLTASGFKYGSAILNKHTTIRNFLCNKVGISPEVADEEACLMEHVISDSSFVKWVEFINKLD